MQRKLLILFLSLLLLNSCVYTIDQYGINKDFTTVLKSAGIDKQIYLNLIEQKLANNPASFERAELLLIKSRLTVDPENQVKMLDYYDRALEEAEGEEKALIYETIAALTGSKYYHLRAAWKWKSLGNDQRAKLHLSFAEGVHPALEFETSKLESSAIAVPENISAITIGKTTFILDKDDLLLSQTERVSRDWLTAEVSSPYQDKVLTMFSEKLTYNKEDLREDLGWHEGSFVKTAKDAGIKSRIATGTLVAKRDGRWYAPNENGTFMFEVPEDKILYPTTRFFSNRLALIMDTHGVNMLVAQAIRENATAVIACCDFPGKIKAAKYLSDRGIKVICNTDRFVPQLLGERAKVIGSAPVEIVDNDLLIGNRPITIKVNEPIVVENATDDRYGLFYYDTPARYFTELQRLTGLKLQTTYITIDQFNQTELLIKEAEKERAKIIALRVFSKEDYQFLKAWLLKDKENRAILFHTIAYPYGKLIFQEFKGQVSFDDVNPEFEG